MSTTVSSIGASSSATVTTAVSSHPSSGATAPAPTLRILSPHDGEQFSLPADIHYSVQGWRPALGSARLLVYPGTDPAASFVITLVIDPSGDVVVLEDDKRLPGRKDLTFQLASAEHGPIDGPGARQTLREVRISGSR